jgi:hypothetical protein
MLQQSQVDDLVQTLRKDFAAIGSSELFTTAGGELAVDLNHSTPVRAVVGLLSTRRPNSACMQLVQGWSLLISQAVRLYVIGVSYN